MDGVFSNTSSHVKMWFREGTPSSESVSLALTSQHAAHSALSLNVLNCCRGFQSKHDNDSAYLDVATDLFLRNLGFVAFLVVSRVFSVGKNVLLR